MSKTCHTPHCSGTVGDNSQIGLCRNCYSAMYYWHKKGPRALVRRSQKLQIFRGRMDLLMPSSTALIKYTKPKPLAIMPGEFIKGRKRKIKLAV